MEVGILQSAVMVVEFPEVTLRVYALGVSLLT